MSAVLSILASIGSDLIGKHLFGAAKTAGWTLETLAPMGVGLLGRTGVVGGVAIATFVEDREFRGCIETVAKHVLATVL